MTNPEKYHAFPLEFYAIEELQLLTVTGGWGGSY